MSQAGSNTGRRKPRAGIQFQRNIGTATYGVSLSQLMPNYIDRSDEFPINFTNTCEISIYAAPPAKYTQLPGMNYECY